MKVKIYYRVEKVEVIEIPKKYEDLFETSTACLAYTEEQEDRYDNFVEELCKKYNADIVDILEKV